MTGAVRAKRVVILLVDDDAEDRELAVEALKDAGFSNRVYEVADGEQALAFLRNEGGFRYFPRPDLVLLDHHLPRKNGREVLAEMRADGNLRDIPVQVMTLPNLPEDLKAAYDDLAAGFVDKPLDAHDLCRRVLAVLGLRLRFGGNPREGRS